MKNKNNDECPILHNKFFEPYFQPIINIKTRTCIGAEVLAGLIRPKYSTLNYHPDLLIGCTDQCEITKIVLRKVLELLECISPPEDFKLIFNIPVNLLAENWLLNICDELLEICHYKLILILELTELTPSLINNDATKNGLSRLSIKNILFAFDNFCTGHFNINLVKKHPFDIIAEGVESTEQSHWLSKKWINLQQGDNFSHPINSIDFLLYLNKSFSLSKEIDNTLHYKKT